MCGNGITGPFGHRLCGKYMPEANRADISVSDSQASVEDEFMSDRMTRFVPIVCLLVSLLAFPALAKAPPSRVTKPILGDFAGEIRRPDGHIDIDANIAALKAMSANTYFYLIWHKRTDWDDLPAFAAAARREGIDIWVYIIPWSETPLVKKSWGYSEPFRTDYIRWAEEIGRLSLEQPNIVGYVIDDFYTNTQPDRFSESYVEQMVSAGKRINPKLKFYPLVYFGQPWELFTERFGKLVDGVVAAYPKSRLQVGNALAYLNGQPHGVTATVELPRTSSRPGDKGSVVTNLRVVDPANASVSFYWDSGDHGENSGYHMAFVRVDGRLIWQTDTAEVAGDGGDHVVDLDLSRVVRRGDDVQIEIGIVERRGVSKYAVTARFDDIRLTGFDTRGEMVSERMWRKRVAGSFKVNIFPAASERRELHLPMILMPAGESEQHEKRYPEAGSPRNIARKVAMSLDLVRDGRVEGVVTYCLPKEPRDPVYEAVRQEYRRAADALRRGGDREEVLSR